MKKQNSVTEPKKSAKKDGKPVRLSERDRLEAVQSQMIAYFTAVGGF